MIVIEYLTYLQIQKSEFQSYISNINIIFLYCACIYICSNTLCSYSVTGPLRLSAACCFVDVQQLLNPSLLSVSGNKFAALFRLSGH